MISSRARKAFLSRRLRNFDFLKDYTLNEVNEAIGELDPQPKTIFGKNELWVHQKVALLLMLEIKRFLLFNDLGLGKTITCLNFIDYRKLCGEKPRAIVFVPYITAVLTWIEEVEKHLPNLKCIPLVGTTKENKHSLENDEGDLFVITYQSATAMVARKTPVKKSKKVNWKLTAADVRKFFAGFDMLVMDEIHSLKSASSMYFRLCRAISREAEWVFGLTGTPFGRDLSDLWAQFYVVDLGATLGDTLGLFRAAFFNETHGYFGGYKYTFIKTKLPLLQNVIKNSSIRYAIDEVYDMPPKMPVVRKLRLTESLEGYYTQAQAKLQAAMKSKTDRYNKVQSVFTQMRQLASGFMTFKGEDSSKVQIQFDDNPKLDALMDLIEAMPHDAKMVIFHDYIYTNHMISKELKKHKIKHCCVWGGTKDKFGELKRFKNDPEYRHLVINCKSGSSSQNLQMANYVVFFEPPRSSIDREQAEKRCWRPGQLKKVFIYDLLVKGTVDEKQWKYNKSGKDLLSAVLDGKETI